jgi:hypothetical protein
MIFFTIANFAYLSRVEILVKTFKKHNNSVFYLFIMEKKEVAQKFEDSLYGLGIDKIIYVEDLGFSKLENWIFSKDIVTASTGVKAKCFKYIDKVDSRSKIVYLDPDIEIFDNFYELNSLLEKNDIILTPHLSFNSDNISNISEYEYSIIKHGLFNLGFLAINITSNSRNFLDWWDYRLETNCEVNFQEGIFTDQKWVDSVPLNFDRVLSLKNPGYNLATWNSNQRPLNFSNEKFFIDTEPLIFIHHSSSGQKRRIEQIDSQNDKLFVRLAYNYEQMLAESKFSTLFSEKWSYNYFNDSEILITNEIKNKFLKYPQLNRLGSPYHSLFVRKFLTCPVYLNPNKLIRYVLSSTLENFNIYKYGLKSRHSINQSTDYILGSREKYLRTQLELVSNFLNPSNPTVLQLSHDAGGGVSHHISHLLEYTFSKVNNILITPLTQNGNRCGFRLFSKILYHEAKVDFDDLQELIDFISKLNINFIHWHHFMGLEDAVYEITRVTSIPYGITVHDFYMFTPNWSLLDNNKNLIEIPIPTTESTFPPMESASTNFWDSPNRTKEFINKSRFTIFPSRFVQREFELRGYTSNHQNFMIPHMESKLRVKHNNNSKNLQSLHDLRIAVVGDIGEQKGESIILDLLSLPKKERPKIVLFGIGSEVLTSAVDEYWGMYTPTQLLQDLVNAEIDAFWFPFKSRETFSYVLGETMCTNLPIFATNLGAIPERLAQYPFGYLLEHDSSPSKTIEKIEKVLLTNKNLPKPKSVKFSDLDYSHSWYLNKYVELIT